MQSKKQAGEVIHGVYGYGITNLEGTKAYELCAAADLVITNTYFTHIRLTN